ncbi:MAG: hypothetical protein WBG70_17655 [Spirulinaceae cyanobacterium]
MNYQAFQCLQTLIAHQESVDTVTISPERNLFTQVIREYILDNLAHASAT